jgi:hypothetical protein
MFLLYTDGKCVSAPQSAGATATMFILYTIFFLFTPFYLFLLPFFISSSSCAYKPAATVCTLYKRVYKLLLFGQIEFPRPFSRSTNGQCWCNLLENLDGRTGHTSLAAQGDEILNSWRDFSFSLLIADWKYLMINESHKFIYVTIAKRDHFIHLVCVLFIYTERKTFRAS